MTLRELIGSFWPGRRERNTPRPTTREPVCHVVVLDGTMSSLRNKHETNAGLTFKLLRRAARGGRLSVHYEPGIQWRDWKSTGDVVAGRGINRQIQRAYGFLASRYRPGDRIYLIGYSRGAYAVRSLAGCIDTVGLLKRDNATVRGIRQVWRHYRAGGGSEAALRFRLAYCHNDVRIEAVGCWDTVKSLGVRLPVLWRFTNDAHAFHNHNLGAVVKNGFHALALDETRQAYAPVMWQSREGWPGERLEQVWFRGSHGDVGGHITPFLKARPLANISLVWMLGRLADCGLPLPEGWAAEFPQDVNAPSIGRFMGWGKLFLSRRSRVIMEDPSESYHPTARPNAPLMAAPGSGGPGPSVEKRKEKRAESQELPPSPPDEA